MRRPYDDDAAPRVAAVTSGHDATNYLTFASTPRGAPYDVGGRCVAMTNMGDIEDIQRVKYRYLRALDTKHWDDFADTLTVDVIGDYGESLGEKHHFDDRASLVEFMRTSMPAGVLTEHRVTHPEIDVDGDDATAIWYLQDKVIVPEFDFMLIGAGFYRDRYRRTSDGWRISATGYDRTYDASLSTKNLDFKVKAGRAVQI